MFRTNLATYPYVNPVNSYAENLGRAARSFLAALLAVDQRRIDALAKNTVATDQNEAASIDELNRLADHFDAIMPNQAAELRFLAGSGA